VSRWPPPPYASAPRFQLPIHLAVTSADSIAHVLQLSVAPTALISGAGLLTLCTTNRMAHLLDRLRSLCLPGRQRSEKQIAVLVRRAHLLRVVLISFLTSMLGAVLVVASLFVGHLQGVDVDKLIAGLFVASLTLLAVGLLSFAIEASYNLAAVSLEIESGA
jgi:hypothetical protein